MSKKKRKNAGGAQGEDAVERMDTEQKRDVSRKRLADGADSIATGRFKRRRRKQAKGDLTVRLKEKGQAEEKWGIRIKDKEQNLQLATVAGETGSSKDFSAYDSQEETFRKAHDVHVAKVKGQSVVAGRGRFLEKLRGRLLGGRFRMLNEALYTCSGYEAYELFQKDPTSFSVYHAGYQDQMSRWPLQPVEVVIRWLRARSTKLIVADFGCGDARLAKSVKNKVFSLDLMSSDPSVIVCNMAHSPLRTNSVDIVVFCLSLMGTDYPSFIREAGRVLRTGGSLVIAEVKSRFESENGDATLEQFISSLQSLGFSLVSQDLSNKMFIMLYLHKESSLEDFPGNSKSWPDLKACIYKRR